MEYEPVKDVLRSFIRGRPLFRKMFYFALGRLFLRERYIKRELADLIPRLEGSPRIFDAGFGYGQYSYHLAKCYPDTMVEAAEIEPVMIEDFGCFTGKTSMNNISLVELDLTEMDYNSLFDLVLSVDVMEHIEDDISVFRNVYQALIGGGVFLMHTPHIQEASTGGEGAFVGEHVRDGYTTEELLDKLRGAGFDKIEYTLTYGKNGAFAWRLLQRFPISILGLSKAFFLILPLYLLLVYPLAAWSMRRDLKGDNIQGDGMMVKAWKR